MTNTIDSSTIKIERIIVHDIPKHAKDDFSITPNYSQKESTLTDGLKLFFKDKIVQSISSESSLKICYDKNNSSPIPWIIEKLLKSDGSELVKQSKLIAKNLYEIQVGSNAAGILVIIFGKIHSNNSCIILKLERDKGAQLTLDEETKTYNIHEVKDLMLTQKTKIFKIAFFFLRNDFTVDFDGRIMDFQINLKAKDEVKTWFMNKFLGCKAYEDPKITTQYFYHYTRQFINTLEDDLEKTKYIQDLNSYVQKNVYKISAKEFADDYIVSTAHRNDYKGYIFSKNFIFTSFIKDISQIKRNIRMFAVSFENGISILGEKGSFDSKVKLESLPNGQHRAEITSKIKKIS
jgi:hypothetical protein